MNPRCGFLLGVAVAVALSACGRGQASAPRSAPSEPPPLPADVQQVAPEPSPSLSPAGQGEARGAVAGASTLTATGEFVSPVHSELTSKVPGRVGRVFVDQGARVRKGQPLLELETDYLRLELQRSEAEVERTRAALEDARRDYVRKQGLIAKGSVAQAVFDRSKAAFEQAQAAANAAEATRNLARQRLHDATLFSPIDGVVMERRADVGERLAEDTVTFVIVQTAPLKLRFRVPERYLSAVLPGQPVKATVDPYPNETFDGRVAVVVQAVDPQSRTFSVEAEFANRDGRLKPGLFARVDLDLRKAGAEGRGGPRAQAR